MDAVYLENCLKPIIIQPVNRELSITNISSALFRALFWLLQSSRSMCFQPHSEMREKQLLPREKGL